MLNISNVDSDDTPLLASLDAPPVLWLPPFDPDDAFLECISFMEIVADAGVWGTFLFIDCVRVCLEDPWPWEDRAGGALLVPDKEPPKSGLDNCVALLRFFVPPPWRLDNPPVPVPAPGALLALLRWGFTALSVTEASNIAVAAKGRAILQLCVKRGSNLDLRAKLKNRRMANWLTLELWVFYKMGCRIDCLYRGGVAHEWLPIRQGSARALTWYWLEQRVETHGNSH